MHRPELQRRRDESEPTEYSVLVISNALAGRAQPPLPKVPEVSMKPAACLLDPLGAIIIPTSATSAVDVEVELVIVLARDCKNVDVASAATSSGIPQPTTSLVEICKERCHNGSISRAIMGFAR